MRETKDIKQTQPLPAPNSDFYQIFDVLNQSQQAVVKRVRTFMETQVEPIINRYWLASEFPFELIAGIRDLHIAGTAIQGYGCPGGGALLADYIAMEIARVDCSISTFFGVHSGLAMESICAALKNRNNAGSLTWPHSTRSGVLP